jgi:hypothetical protein
MGSLPCRRAPPGWRGSSLNSSLAAAAAVFAVAACAATPAPPRKGLPTAVIYLPGADPDVTSLRLIVRSGTLNEQASTCGAIHLLEHVWGGHLFARLRPGAGFQVRINGATGPDRMVMSLDTTGGTEGFEAALDAFGELFQNPPDPEEISRELPLVRAERDIRKALGPAAEVIVAMQPAAREKASGTCLVGAPSSAVDDLWRGLRSIPIQLVIVSGRSEDATQSVLQRSSLMRYLRGGSGNRPTVDFDVPKVPLASQPGKRVWFAAADSDLLTSASYWILVGSRLGPSEPRLEPLGDLGYEVSFKTPIAASADEAVAAVRRDIIDDRLTDRQAEEALERARALICRSVNGRTRESIAAADLIAFDPWSGILPLQPSFCSRNSGTPRQILKHWVEARSGGMRQLTIPFEWIAPQAPKPTLAVKICSPPSSTRLDGGAASTEQLTLRELLIRRLRLRDRLALNVAPARSAAEGSRECWGFGLIGVVASPADLVASVRRGTGSFPVEALQARTVACMEWASTGAPGTARSGCVRRGSGDDARLEAELSDATVFNL